MKRRKTDRDASPPGELRIIGGRYRGSKLAYSGDRRTRPMKDRVREAIFNLVGPSIRKTHALDLFAGTGALALEAISRGAHSATLIEQHVPTTRTIRENVHRLGLESETRLVTASAFVWTRRDLGQLPSDRPWAIFCSPPYDFYVDRQAEMLELIARLWHVAPPGSMLVVEADERFDFATLEDADDWNVRSYPPAVVGILRSDT